MKCDHCGKQLTLGNTAGDAPHGLPLYVCTDCYEELSKSTVVKKTSEATPSEGSNIDNNAENYLDKIKNIISTLLPSEPWYVQDLFFQSFSLASQWEAIKYSEYKASSLWLDLTENPTDQELREYISWCWEYHQKRLEMDDVLEAMQRNVPNNKCIHPCWKG